MSTRALVDRAAGVDALPGSQSVRRALDLLSLLATQDHAGGSSLSDLASTSGLPKPTARRLLQELTHAGFAERDPDDLRYRLGAASFVVGNIAERRYPIHAAALPVLRRIVQATEDTAFVSVRCDEWSVCLHREESPWPIRSNLLQAGDRHPLGVGAGSIAMLASLGNDEIEALLEVNRDTITRRYPHCTPDTIRQDVERTRACGYAFNPGRVVTQSWGVGVAIRSGDGALAGALSIACVRHRLPPERLQSLGDLLLRAAKDVTNRLALSSDATTTTGSNS